MICRDLLIQTCFNCLFITRDSIEEVKELSCWVNVYKRCIDMMVLGGVPTNEAIGRQVVSIKNHPVGEPEFPEFYWLRVCIEKYYPEHVNTLEKLLLLT